MKKNQLNGAWKGIFRMLTFEPGQKNLRSKSALFVSNSYIKVNKAERTFKCLDTFFLFQETNKKTT